MYYVNNKQKIQKSIVVGGDDMDYSKLRGKITEVFGTQKAFADAMHISVSNINQRLNCKVEWKAPEIVRACKLLKIELEDAWQYFFVEKL